MTTSPPHEWDEAYRRDGAPPWDIGHPQPVFAALADRGLLCGALLDAGCGTGEHALLAAGHGAQATGVDLSPTAVEQARRKALQRGLDVHFEVGDLLTMPLPDGGFDTVIDSGVFHSFDDTDRGRYVATLARVLRRGGHCYLMCFSDRQPGDWGPRRIRRDEIETAFAGGWTIERIEPAVFEINPLPDVPSVDAWFVAVQRT